MERQVIYEPHPVTPERKAELVAQGYRIVDAKFAPKDVKPALAIPPVIEDRPETATFIEGAFNDIVPETVEALKPRRGRKKKAI